MNVQPRFEDLCSAQTLTLLDQFRQGNNHLAAMATQLDIAWAPETADPRKLHNCYVRNLVAAYVSKVVDLSQSILDGLGRFDYLTYALCGRALIEAVATLRYYVLHQYKPLLDKESLTLSDMKQLVQIDDRHLRGTRFDWDSFLFKNYSKLKEDTVKQLSEKKDKNRSGRSAGAEETVVQQVNVLTCLEKWAAETPEVLIAYNLFCDLVHPNIGSNLLVASVDSGTIYFTKHKGQLVGHQIFEQSFPILLSVALKPFGQHLSVLMASCWHDDELG
jgi:hypothetical protein